jgi:hypothetical protein
MTDVTRPNGDTSDERRATDTSGERRGTDTGAQRRETATGTEGRGTGTGTERRDTGMGTDRRDTATGTDRRENAMGTDRRDPAKVPGQQDASKAADQREATKVTPVVPATTPREADKATTPGEETARGDQQSARPVHAPEPPPSSPGAGVATDKRHGSNGSGNGSLLPHDESDKFSLRLQHAVTGFVDEPRSAVEEADHVLEEVAARFTEAVTKRRTALHGSWESKSAGDTEQLRLALRDYRELTERLLHM